MVDLEAAAARPVGPETPPGGGVVRVDRPLYIVPAIGKVQLAKLQADDINRMRHGSPPRGVLSSTTISYANLVLRIALGEALRSKRVVRNVALKVRAPRASRPERTPLTLAQGRRVPPPPCRRLTRTALPNRYRARAWRGELLGLRWSDVNLEVGALTVRHTRNARTGALTEPKTDRSRRTLRLGGELTATLRALPTSAVACTPLRHACATLRLEQGED